jgi:hypothetical protein
MRKSRRLEENMNRKNQIKADRQKQETCMRGNGTFGPDLADLTKDILILLLAQRQKWMTIQKVVQHFPQSEVKVLTILFVFEGLGMLKILDNRRIVFLGVQGAIQQFLAFVLEKVEEWKRKLEKNEGKDKNLQKIEMLK